MGFSDPGGGHIVSRTTGPAHTAAIDNLSTAGLGYDATPVVGYFGANERGVPESTGWAYLTAPTEPEETGAPTDSGGILNFFSSFGGASAGDAPPGELGSGVDGRWILVGFGIIAIGILFFTRGRK